VTLSFTPESTVAEAAVSNPAVPRLFEALGIDYCCGGKRTIREAATRAGIAPDLVLSSLRELSIAPAPERDWSIAPIPHLVKHIIDLHHGYIRTETPRIEGLLAKVAARHGPLHPEVIELRDVFIALSQELATHLIKEEQIVFPAASQLSMGFDANSGCFGSIGMPIARMFEEHDDAGALLASIRRLTNNFHPPEDACMSFKALYHALGEFERDLHRHIHLENNILFPKAIEAEARLRQ